MRAENRLHRAAVTAVAVGLLASGCGSGHGPAAAKAAAPSASSAGATTAAATAASGTASSSASSSPSTSPSSGGDLLALMVPATTLGKDFVLNSKAGGPVGGGTGSSDIADVTQADCSKMLHSSWTVNLGNGNGSALQQYKTSDREVTEMFDHFESTIAAQTFVENVSKLATFCAGRVTDPDTQAKVTFTTHPVTGLGDEASAITVGAPTWKSGDTLEAARVGDVVASVFVISLVDNDTGAGLATTTLTDAVAKLKAAGAA